MNQCLQCSQRPSCRSTRLSWFFFFIGMAATISLRAVAVLMHVNQAYSKVAWYIGVVGFFLFFLNKYMIESRRRQMIIRLGLREKIRQGRVLSEDDRGLLGDILCSLSTSKDRFNYLLIFSTSIIALVLAVYLDWIKK